jgi:hypothetical protein
LSENIAVFHSNDDPFTQYLFLNKKKVSFDDFSGRLESKRRSARGKRNSIFNTNLNLGVIAISNNKL